MLSGGLVFPDFEKYTLSSFFPTTLISHELNEFTLACGFGTATSNVMFLLTFGTVFPFGAEAKNLEPFTETAISGFSAEKIILEITALSLLFPARSVDSIS